MTNIGIICNRKHKISLRTYLSVKVTQRKTSLTCAYLEYYVRVRWPRAASSPHATFNMQVTPNYALPTHIGLSTDHYYYQISTPLYGDLNRLYQINTFHPHIIILDI